MKRCARCTHKWHPGGACVHTGAVVTSDGQPHDNGCPCPVSLTHEEMLRIQNDRVIYLLTALCVATGALQQSPEAAPRIVTLS